jgi:NADPH:quinone reductase-like Zn-dependent oxidoreductase
VITTASASNLDYVRELGADQVIDYKSQDFTKVVSACDAVFDTVGGDVATRSFARCCVPVGRAAFIGSGNRSAPVSPRAGVASLRPKGRSGSPHLERVADLVAKRAVRVPESRLPALGGRGSACCQRGPHWRGKLVFKVR